MKLIILTSSSHGTASRLLKELNNNPNLEITTVVHAHGVSPNKKRLLTKKIRKIIKIGILGALNGIRIRKWYSYHNVIHIEELCNELNIKYEKVNFINTKSTVELFKNSRADLGLSLGNGYIGKKVFSIPKFGMINVHTELLPRFQGAQSIIWPIYENIKSTGFTIHKIDTSIDTGNILYKEDFPIKFHSTLEKTVRFNIELTRKKLSKALSDVCENFKKFNDKSIMQIDGKTYTTPTIFQYYKMKKNNLKLYKLQLKNDI